MHIEPQQYDTYLRVPSHMLHSDALSNENTIGMTHYDREGLSCSGFSISRKVRLPAGHKKRFQSPRDFF